MQKLGDKWKLPFNFDPLPENLALYFPSSCKIILWLLSFRVRYLQSELFNRKFHSLFSPVLQFQHNFARYNEWLLRPEYFLQGASSVSPWQPTWRRKPEKISSETKAESDEFPTTVVQTLLTLRKCLRFCSCWLRCLHWMRPSTTAEEFSLLEGYERTELIPYFGEHINQGRRTWNVWLKQLFY